MKHLQELVGKKCEDITGKKISEVMGPDGLRIFSEEHEHELHDHPGVTTRGHITYSDGSVHEISVQKSTFANTDGTLAGTVTMVLSDRAL